jgi:hypothetical protein
VDYRLLLQARMWPDGMCFEEIHDALSLSVQRSLDDAGHILCVCVMSLNQTDGVY